MEEPGSAWKNFSRACWILERTSDEGEAIGGSGVGAGGCDRGKFGLVENLMVLGLQELDGPCAAGGWGVTLFWKILRGLGTGEAACVASSPFPQFPAGVLKGTVFFSVRLSWAGGL